MTVELIIRYGKVLAVFLLLWAGVWAFNNYGCRRVAGSEMEPAIPKEKSALIDPKARHPRDLEREDIISYTYPQPGISQADVAARVIGLPGDKVKIVKGQVYVNGEALPSSYVNAKFKSVEDYAEIIVPRDTVFVLCDNRTYKNYDSRAIGPVGIWAIAGKIR